uniref:Ig-like domain-containing protein n=1 Tax=Amazona collaria TaxID=241587 RepID=A0A8B9F7D4_9PSIT
SAGPFLLSLWASSSPCEPVSSPNPDPAESIPTMLDSFQSREVRAGRPVELPCIASGYPNPAVRWIKDGRPLPADSRWTKRITGLSISELRVEDSGTYICEVTNTFGSAEVTGTLTVIGESPRGGQDEGPREYSEQCWGM